MKSDSIYIFRKVLVAITLVLLFTTLGLFMVTTQTKTINLEYYGNSVTIKTLASTVQDFLMENNIVLAENETVYPEKNAFVEDGTSIRISSLKKTATLNIDEKRSEYTPMVAKIEEVIEIIPFKEETRSNSSVERGTTNIVNEGSEGQKSIKYIVKYNGTEEIERAQISTEILVEAKNKVIEVGTKLPALASRSSIVQSVAAQVPTATDGFVQYNISLPLEQQHYAFNICKKYGIEYELFLAIMYKESRFNSGAIGANSYGLCQIHGSNFSMLSRRLGISNLYDPYDNMTAGAYLLSTYFGIAKKYVSGNDITVFALNAYNMGEGAYYTTCFSQGVLHRGYSTSVISIRDRIKANGGI